MFFISYVYCPTWLSNIRSVACITFQFDIPLGSLYACLSLSCCCIVLVVLKATFKLVCLNRLVTRLISGIKCVKVTHFLRATVFSCCCFWLCFRNISFLLRLCIMSIGYPLVFAIARIIFHIPTAAHKQTHCLLYSASYRTAHLLYKLYSLQLNCTYSNYTEAAAICSAAQQHTNSPIDVFGSAVSISVRIHSVMSLDRTFQINATAWKHSVTSLQHYETHPTVPLFRITCICTQSHSEIRSIKFTLLAASAMSQFDSDKEQVTVTKVTDTMFKLKKRLIILSTIR